LPFKNKKGAAPLPLFTKQFCNNSIFSTARTSTKHCQDIQPEGAPVPTLVFVAVAHSSETNSGELKTGRRKM
jgi:hypothetical protein